MVMDEGTDLLECRSVKTTHKKRAGQRRRRRQRAVVCWLRLLGSVKTTPRRRKDKSRGGRKALDGVSVPRSPPLSFKLVEGELGVVVGVGTGSGLDRDPGSLSRCVVGNLPLS